MNSRAEETALKAYPRSDFQSVNTQRKALRDCFIQGYEQAEKDLALTWGDIDIIYSIMLGLDKNEFPAMSVAFYKEVLRRFNEQRKK